MAWPLLDPLLIDRAADRRATVELGAADAVVASAGHILVRGDRLAIIPASERRAGSLAIFLGRHGHRDIVAIPAEDGPVPDDEVGDVRLVPLRSAIGVLGASPDGGAELELAETAVAMIEWHERQAFCGRCGSATEPHDGGWVRRCVAQAHEHYPRTDPAVIVAITDEEDRLLLAHVAYHSAGRYSHLAGYVEPGESLEQAAHREVAEEASLRLEGLEYVGSQPWPLPASIMLAFRARAKAAELRVDGTEVTDAAWFTREGLVAALASGTVQLAAPGTIARALLHEWFGGDPAAVAGVTDA